MENYVLSKKQKIDKILTTDANEESKVSIQINYNTNLVNKIKSKLKSYPEMYDFIVTIISPVYTLSQKKHLRTFLNDIENFNEKIVMNLGSGYTEIHPDVINVDVYPYKNVDFVSDITNLPFKSNSIDAIINIAVLEHVSHPIKVINEIHRVLKPDGMIYSCIPFIQGFHASPYDYQRYTEEGIKVLHEKFNPTQRVDIGGPTSGMLWVLQEWLAIVFSFGNKKLHLIITTLLMIITWPVKFLDFLLILNPMAKNIATVFTFVGKK